MTNRRDFMKSLAVLPAVALLPEVARPEPSTDPLWCIPAELTSLKIGTLTLTERNTFTTNGTKWHLSVDDFTLTDDNFSFTFRWLVCLDDNPNLSAWITFEKCIEAGTLFYILGERFCDANTTNFYLRGYKCQEIQTMPNHRLRLLFSKDKTPYRPSKGN